MTPKARLALFPLAGLLMCGPGLFPAGMERASIAPLAVGCAVLIVAAMKNGGTQARTALTLLITANVSFWLSHCLWLLRLKLLSSSSTGGIDPYAGPLALWVILLITLLPYVWFVFVRGLIVNRERPTAAIGLIVSIAQVLVTMNTAYALVQGV